MPGALISYHYLLPQTAHACNSRADGKLRGVQRRRAESTVPPLPAHRCRQQRQPQGTRVVSLFGFGSKPSPTSEQLASAQSSPLLIPFTPIQKTKDYSLRLFNAYTVAEVEYLRRDEGFLAIGSYMSGHNDAEARCCETQPVVMCYSPDGSKKMQVHIVLRAGSGSEGGSSLPPAPNNAEVQLGIAGGEVVATRQFQGNATQEACERCRQQLMAALKRDGLQLAEAEAGGCFRLAQYGPLHSLSTRMNEIWLAVKLG